MQPVGIPLRVEGAFVVPLELPFDSASRTKIEEFLLQQDFQLDMQGENFIIAKRGTNWSLFSLNIDPTQYPQEVRVMVDRVIYTPSGLLPFREAHGEVFRNEAVLLQDYVTGSYTEHPTMHEVIRKCEKEGVEGCITSLFFYPICCAWVTFMLCTVLMILRGLIESFSPLLQ